MLLGSVSLATKLILSQYPQVHDHTLCCVLKAKYKCEYSLEAWYVSSGVHLPQVRNIGLRLLNRSLVQGRLPVHGGQRWRKVWPVLNTYCPYFYHASYIDVATLPKKWLLLPTPLKGIRSNYGKNSLYSFVKLKEVLRVNCRFKVKSW